MSTARRDLAIGLALLAAIVAVLAFADDSASADSGITGVSRHAGQPGAEVRLTIVCGFCGNRTFPVLLLPLARAERMLQCHIHHYRRCARPTAPPRHPPYTYLGAAPPVSNGDAPKALPRYRLDFRVPRLRPGDYAYVLWSEPRRGGEAGSLVTFPTDPLWRLRILPSSGRGPAGATMGGRWPRWFASTSTATSTFST